MNKKIFFLVAIILLFGCSQETNEFENLERFEVSQDDDPFVGAEDAPVTIIAFEDFQCPFCQRFNWEVMPRLKRLYIDTGKAKFVFRDFPLSHLHPMAQKAAEAAECADEQGKFWEYHDILFEKQNFLSVDNMKEWAAKEGLNSEQFNECLDSGAMEGEVLRDQTDGRRAGASSTPTIFINGVPIKGLYQSKVYEDLIEHELSRG